MAERFWVLHRCRLFERLAPDRLARLEARARMRSFAKGDLVYLPSDAADGVLLLAEGRVRLTSVTPDGKQAVLAFVEPGELFGELALIDGGPREEFAEAAAASLVICLPADAVLSLMEDDAGLAFGVTKLIGFRRRRVERRLKSLLFRSGRDRLVHLLLELVEEYGKPQPDGVLIGMRLSHQELASVIGSTRETVTLLLGELQLEGYLRVGRQKIVVRAPAALASLLGLPAPNVPAVTPDRPPLRPSFPIPPAVPPPTARSVGPLTDAAGGSGR